MSKQNEITEKIHTCRNCHTSGYMKILGDFSYRDEEYDTVIEYGETVHHWAPYYESWIICICINCGHYNVMYSFTDLDNQTKSTDPSIIYPPSITFKASDPIDLVFRAAIEILHINPAAAVNQFRVIIEMIWKEHNGEEITKPKLRGNNGMIKNLLDLGVLTGNYADMADVLANIGNKGSHYEEKSVTKTDAEMARDLCAAILEHIYNIRKQGLAIIQKLEARFPRENGWRNGVFVDKSKW